MDNESKQLLITLIKDSKIGSLGTSSKDQPYVSLVAFAISKNYTEIYIHLSQLAKHTKNIMQNNKVSLMISQSEMTNENPQSLARVTLSGTVSLVNKTSSSYEYIKELYLKKNPQSQIYFSLGDFEIYKIDIDKARYVAGFAKTFNLTKTTLQNLTN